MSSPQRQRRRRKQGSELRMRLHPSLMRHDVSISPYQHWRIARELLTTLKVWQKKQQANDSPTIDSLIEQRTGEYTGDSADECTVRYHIISFYMWGLSDSGVVPRIPHRDVVADSIVWFCRRFKRMVEQKDLDGCKMPTLGTCRRALIDDFEDDVDLYDLCLWLLLERDDFDGR